MRIVNDKALNFARGPGYCDWCRKPVSNRNPHHVFSRGAGQVDVKFNIAALCETFSGGRHCHQLVHSGEIDDGGVLAMVAARERCSQDDIRELIYLIRRLDRHTSREQLFAAIERECRPSARELAGRTL